MFDELEDDFDYEDEELSEGLKSNDL